MDIEALYNRYGPMVMRRCRQLLRDEDDAMDVTQDVFVNLMRHRERLKAVYPSSLLYRIATNLCLNRIRDNQRLSEAPGDEVLCRIAGLTHPGPRLDARVMLDRLFGRHRASTRTMAVLHFLDGMTLEEVAREVGMSVSGVRKRLRGLRETLLAMEEDDNGFSGS